MKEYNFLLIFMCLFISSCTDTFTDEEFGFRVRSNKVIITNDFIAEDIANTTVIGILSLDSDGFDAPYTYEILGATSPFTIVGEELVVSDNSTIDFEFTPSYELSIRATGAFGDTYDSTLQLQVTNVNEPCTGVDNTVPIYYGRSTSFSASLLTLNDIDLDASSNLTIQSFGTNGTNSLASAGTLTFDSNTNIFSYTPVAYSTTDATFDYIATDGEFTCSATVTLDIKFDFYQNDCITCPPWPGALDDNWANEHYWVNNGSQIVPPNDPAKSVLVDRQFDFSSRDLSIDSPKELDSLYTSQMYTGTLSNFEYMTANEVNINGGTLEYGNAQVGTFPYELRLNNTSTLDYKNASMNIRDATTFTIENGSTFHTSAFTPAQAFTLRGDVEFNLEAQIDVPTIKSIPTNATNLIISGSQKLNVLGDIDWDVGSIDGDVTLLGDQVKCTSSFRGFDGSIDFINTLSTIQTLDCPKITTLATTALNIDVNLRLDTDELRIKTSFDALNKAVIHVYKGTLYVDPGVTMKGVTVHLHNRGSIVFGSAGSCIDAIIEEPGWMGIYTPMKILCPK